MNRPSKVAEFDLPVPPNEEVLRFDVPVDDVPFLQIDEGVGNVGDVLCSGRLGEDAAGVGHKFVDLASGGFFQD